MKPTPQISSNQRPSPGEQLSTHERRNFPPTDYNFQPTENRSSSRAFAEKRHILPDLRAFRKISSDFFDAESRRDYVAEGLLFIVITAVSAWPIISMFAALGLLMK